MPIPFELHHNVKLGNLDRVRELLSNSHEIDTRDLAGYTPLMYAVESSAAAVEMVRLLLDQDADLTANCSRDGAQYTIGALCIKGGNPKKLALLIERGVDLHYQREGGYNALLDAAYAPGGEPPERLLEVLRILLRQRVALNSITSYGESALRSLSRIGRFDAVKLLLDTGADESQLSWTPLIRAAAIGTKEEVAALIQEGARLAEPDYWSRTAWLVAVLAGDIPKADLLLQHGADRLEVGNIGQSGLFFAIEAFRMAMLRWLIEIGLDIEGMDSFGNTPLMKAVGVGNAEAVDILLEAGAEPGRRGPAKPLPAGIPAGAASADLELRSGPAIREAQDAYIIRRLLAAGADSGELSFEGRRAAVGLPRNPDEALFDATPEDFRDLSWPCWGEANPDKVDSPFWNAMIRSGITAYAGTQLCGGTHDDSPVWCAQRFGQSITLLPDGRIIQIGGEHEDFYDPDFYIYNDVFVHHPDGRIDIYCYPEDVFGPTDFHTATLIGSSIYIIGTLGYQGRRRIGETPVHLLNIDTLEICAVQTSGSAPGWISRHRAALAGTHEIRVWGGKIIGDREGKSTYDGFHGVYLLNVSTGEWRLES
jgi:ankyrin repeat protein